MWMCSELWRARIVRWLVAHCCLVCFPLAKRIPVVSGIAVHARVNAQKDQLQHKALQRAAPSMTVHIEAFTLGALANRRPRVPHAPRC